MPQPRRQRNNPQSPSEQLTGPVDRFIETMKPRRLWHYCCDHSVEGIIKDDTIKPHPGGHQEKASLLSTWNVVALPVIWLTDIDVMTVWEADMIGLGRNTEFVTCNRVQYRFRVSSTQGEWWPDWADRAVKEDRLNATYRELLELDRQPEHWWVSEKPIRSPHLDERYRGITLTRSPSAGTT